MHQPRFTPCSRYVLMLRNARFVVVVVHTNNVVVCR